MRHRKVFWWALTRYAWRFLFKKYLVIMKYTLNLNLMTNKIYSPEIPHLIKSYYRWTTTSCSTTVFIHITSEIKIITMYCHGEKMKYSSANCLKEIMPFKCHKDVMSFKYLIHLFLYFFKKFCRISFHF